MTLKEMFKKYPSFTDISQEEYKQELLDVLEIFYEKIPKEAMSEHQLFLQGRADMLNEIIEFIKEN